MASILFTTTNGPVSRVIRAITRSEISHCGIGLQWYGVPVVLHADFGGVIVMPRARFESLNTVRYEFDAPHVKEERLQDAVGMLDLPYDYAGLFGHLPVVFGRWVRRKIRNPFRDPKRLVCSELVLRVFQDAEVFRGIDPEDASPEDILGALQKGAPAVVI